MRRLKVHTVPKWEVVRTIFLVVACIPISYVIRSLATYTCNTYYQTRSSIIAELIMLLVVSIAALIVLIPVLDPALPRFLAYIAAYQRSYYSGRSIGMLRRKLFYARISGNQRMVIDARFDLIAAYQVDGQVQPATALLKEQLELTRRLGDPALEAATIIILGGVSAQLGLLSDAMQLYRQAFTLIRGRPAIPRALEALCLACLGSGHLARGEVRLAMVCCRQALDVSRRMDSRPVRYQVLHVLGWAFALNGEPARARQIQLDVLALARAHDDHVTVGATLIALAVLSHELGDTPAAVVYIQRALAVARHARRRLDEADALWAWGGALAAMGQRDAAIGRAREAIAMFERAGSPRAERVRQKIAEWELRRPG